MGGTRRNCVEDGAPAFAEDADETDRTAFAHERIAMSFITHGLSKTPTYQSWESMNSRIKTAHYKRRNITICSRWRKFEFFHLDMGERPANHSLDRINNNLGYSKKNCRWATMEEQNWNKSDTLRIEHDGTWWTVRTIARQFNLTEHCVRWRFRMSRRWEYLTMPPSRGKHGLR